MSERIAHSAEHAFVGALQKIMGKTLAVSKVEHKGAKNSAFIADDDLSLEKVNEAERAVNLLISAGAKITEREFPSIDAAKAAVQALRANEKRISGSVRVVEIQGHDAAACSMEHASDIKECGFFLVTGFGRAGSQFQVDFAVGEAAKEEASRISAILHSVCAELGANVNTVENTVKKMKLRNQESAAKLKAITKQHMAGMKNEKIGDVVLSYGSFANLDEDQVVEAAGSFVKGSPAILIIVNAFGDRGQVVLARSESISGLDLNALLKQCPGNPRGGGRPHFVTGVIDSKMAESFLDCAVSAARRMLSVG